MKKIITLLLIIFVLYTPLVPVVDKATAATDIINDGTLSSNLVSCFELDETSGTRADSQGSNDLSSINTVGSATGIQGNGADFETTGSPNQYLDKSAPTGMTGTTAYSFQAWIKPESVASTQSYIGHSESGDANIHFQSWIGATGEATFRRGISGSSITLTTSGAGITAGNWYHMVGTFSTTNGMILYINGTSAATNSTLTTNTLPSSAPHFVIGQRWRGGAANLPFDGVVDVAAVWNKELTSTDVSALYNSGSGIPCDAGGGGGGGGTTNFQDLYWF